MNRSQIRVFWMLVVMALAILFFPAACDRQHQVTYQHGVLATAAFVTATNLRCHQ